MTTHTSTVPSTTSAPSQTRPSHSTADARIAAAVPMDLPDPRPMFARASALACDVVAAVRPDQLSGPTPCTDYDVLALIGHTVAVLRRVAAVGRGEDPHSVLQVIPDAEHGWGAAAADAAADVAEVWADPSVLSRLLVLPFATLPGAVALAVYTGELTTHTWDIAVSTGQSPQWDGGVVAAALAAARRALPEDNRGEAVPFERVVAVPDNAPLIDQLAGWQGRDPAWRPTS